MAEPVTIGGQTFIKNEKGWIDQKTKVKAPEGLITLLNKVAEEQSPAGMKKRAILDNTYVVKFGDSEYVWDMNNQVFVDKKTKNPVPKHLSSILEAAAGMKKASAEDKSKASAGVINNMGSTGQAAKQKVKKPSGGGQLPVANVKINSPIIKMIEKLSVIDGYLKQRLANDTALANSQSVAAKEQAIEQPAIQTDATPNLTENVDAEVEKTNKESQAILIAGAAAAGALFISQLDPVKETFNSIIGFAKSVYNFASGIVGVINEGLVRIVGTPESRGEQIPTSASSATAVSGASRSSMAPGAGETEDGAAFAGPETGSTGSRASNGPATPEEITTPFPGPTSSSNVGKNTASSSVAAAAASTPNATRVSSPPSATPTRSATPQPSTSTRAPAPTGMGAFSSYTGSAGKLSNDPVVRDKAFSTAPQSNNQPSTTGSIPKNDIVALGNYLIGQGAQRDKLQHSAFGAVGEHSRNSRHYRGMAIDVNFPGPNEGAILDALEPQLRAAGYNTIWRKKGHMTHMHVSVGGPEGGDIGSGESVLQQVATAGVALTRGAMEAIGTILRAGIGSDTMRPTSGSQLSTVNDTMSGNIAKAARERTSEVAALKTPETATTASSAPMNMGTSGRSASVGSVPTASDRASVEFYLTRMGFPPIHYTQTSWNATVR